MSVFGDSYSLFLPFKSDDIEEMPSNLLVSVSSTNANLVPNTNLIVSVLKTNPFYQLLSIKTVSNVYGSTTINLSVLDHGIISERTGLMMAVPGINVTNNFPNFALKPTVVVGSSSVTLKWTPMPNLAPNYPYKILRTTSANVLPPNTIGSTSGTNYVDNSVVNGTTYYYSISFVPDHLTNYFGPPTLTNYSFRYVVTPVVPLTFLINGFAFQGYSNKVYGIFTKTNITQTIWNRMTTITNTSDRIFIFVGDQYKDKIIYVREEL